MNEIERLAEAALANINEQSPAPYGPDDRDPDPLLWDDMRAHLDAVKVNDHFSLIDLTCAILQAMREPSEEQRAIIFEAMTVEGGDRDRRLERVGTWWIGHTALIDHLLSE